MTVLRTSVVTRGEDMTTVSDFEVGAGETIPFVLTYGPRGGVYLAGGILPRIKDHLLHSDFYARFLDKGAMRPVLERVPVMLVEQGQLGVLGAAGWYLAHHHNE